MAEGDLMTALGQALSDYLVLRRRLGYALERDQPQLEQFIGFLEGAGAERITTELGSAACCAWPPSARWIRRFRRKMRSSPHSLHWSACRARSMPWSASPAGAPSIQPSVRTWTPHRP